MCLMVFMILKVKWIYLFILLQTFNILFLLYFNLKYSSMHVQAYVCMYMYACTSTCVFEYKCTCVFEYTCTCMHVYTCVCGYVFVCICMFLFACFTNYSLLIVCYQQCTKGGVCKYFTSASTFLHSICDIINVANYNALLQFSFYASLINVLHQCLILLRLFC